MEKRLNFYINGEWVTPLSEKTLSVENPATETAVTEISMGSVEDVNRAVVAARAAFTSFSKTLPSERADLLDKIAACMQARAGDLAASVTAEMGAPAWLASDLHVPMGLGHFATTAAILRNFAFETVHNSSLIQKEAIGVCGLITPWNWPLNQLACKIAPAIAAGCTVVLKPSEISPTNAMILAEIMDEAGVPAGVFNLVNGDGPTVGAAISSHPDIDMVSFTGSTRAGILVAQAAAPSVKRVSQELGGKSANIILPSADLQSSVTQGVQTMMLNSGQSCIAPSRMLVPLDQNQAAMDIAKATAEAVVVSDPLTGAPGSIGPIANKTQYDKIQSLMQAGIDEGATLLAGGPGRADGFARGYFARPTVFANVSNEMTIAREEIFGPVLTIIPYVSVDEAVSIANDSEYGLAGYVSGAPDEANSVAKQMRTGFIQVNSADMDVSMPFGGYGKSGNGREWGEYGIDEFLEVKSLVGYSAA